MECLCERQNKVLLFLPLQEFHSGTKWEWTEYMYVRAVYVNMSSCPCGYPVCFMDCLIALLLYETEWMVSYLSSERCKIWWNDTNGMWESVLLTVSWQSFEIHRRIWMHAWEINQQQPFAKKHVRMCLECSHHLYWTCSACWVWWSLCCHGCWWLLPWTGTSAEVSGLTEPHPLKGSKNTQLKISNWGKKLHLQFKMYIRTQRETVHIKHLSGL